MLELPVRLGSLHLKLLQQEDRDISTVRRIKRNQPVSLLSFKQQTGVWKKCLLNVNIWHFCAKGCIQDKTIYIKLFGH